MQPTSQDSDITIPMKVLGASRAAAYLPNCAHTLLQFSPSPPSLFCPLSCFFLNGCLHCSLSFLLYLHLTAFHRAEVPSRRRSVADIPCPWLIIVEWRPSHAYCYLSVWVMLGDKTWAKTLTASRPPQSQCESLLCAGQDVVWWWRGTGPKTETTGWKSQPQSAQTHLWQRGDSASCFGSTCGCVSVISRWLLQFKSMRHHPNTRMKPLKKKKNPKTSWSLPLILSLFSFGNDT